jgi:hypothetical protein
MKFVQKSYQSKRPFSKNMPCLGTYVSKEGKEFNNHTLRYHAMYGRMGTIQKG